MQTLFHENPNRQWITNGHSCMVRVHTKPEYQMMTPDTRHTQASVQITTKTPFSFRCHNNFSAQIQRDNDTAYKTTSAFAFVLQLVQRRSLPSSAVAAAMSLHHSGPCSYLLLVSSMSLSCVPIDHSVRIWSCYAGDSPLLYVHPFHRGCNWTWTLSLLESLCPRHCCHSCPNLPFQRF